MSDYLDKLKSKTRWDNIPETADSYRLLCSNHECSLSCANLRNGKLSVTSMHGNDRHSYVMTKNDMAFAVLQFLINLTDPELETLCQIYNKVSPENVIKLQKL